MFLKVYTVCTIVQIGLKFTTATLYLLETFFRLTAFSQLELQITRLNCQLSSALSELLSQGMTESGFEGVPRNKEERKFPLK